VEVVEAESNPYSVKVEIYYSLRFKMSVVLGVYTHIKKCND
jgi:hypothetical protein